MGKRLKVSLLMFFVLGIWMVSCDKQDNETNISSHSEDESHYTGDNCMNCHYQAGPGEGWYSIAGSVFGNYQNDDYTVRVFDALTQDQLASVEIDQLGNLFTTAPIDFNNGITVDIINSSGNVVKVMSTIVTNGQCNLCHDGQFEEVIEFF